MLPSAYVRVEVYVLQKVSSSASKMAEGFDSANSDFIYNRSVVFCIFSHSRVVVSMLHILDTTKSVVICISEGYEGPFPSSQTGCCVSNGSDTQLLYSA